MIIGLSGKMGTGKSTLATFIMSVMGLTAIVKIASILYELQDMIYKTLGLTLEGEKDRPLLIAIGMWGRSKDENFWTDKAMQRAKELSAQGYTVIIDDCRFPNEAKAIEDAGGLLIRIEGVQRGPNITPEAINTPSECALDEYKFEYVINNQTTQESVQEQFNFILEQFAHRRS